MVLVSLDYLLNFILKKKSRDIFHIKYLQVDNDQNASSIYSL